MEKLLLTLLDSGGPVGILAAVVFILMLFGVYLRQKGMLFSDKSRPVRRDQLASINSKLGTIDAKLGEFHSRIADVELDLKHRPTREEFHALDLAVTRLEGVVNTVDKTTTQTNHAVVRMEEYLRGEKGKRK